MRAIVQVLYRRKNGNTDPEWNFASWGVVSLNYCFCVNISQTVLVFHLLVSVRFCDKYINRHTRDGKEVAKNVTHNRVPLLY